MRLNQCAAMWLGTDAMAILVKRSVNKHWGRGCLACHPHARCHLVDLIIENFHADIHI